VKHQSNLKRFLRDLHRTQEREEREKQKAKDEVQRLNRLVAGSSSGGEASGLPSGCALAGHPPTPHAASLEERKKQMTRLAEMGVAIPEEFRGEMALAGEWQIISEKPIQPRVKEGVTPSTLNIGVRKRKSEEQEEEHEEVNEKVVKKVWGSATRHYPNTGGGEDLDALLENTKDIKRKEPVTEQKIKSGEFGNPVKQETASLPPEEPSRLPTIKSEESSEEHLAKIPSDPNEFGEMVPRVLFKKRKVKSIKR
jgi:hypothetical protein